MFWVFFVLMSVFLFWAACVGMMFNRRNLIVMLLCVELIFLAASLNFILFAKMHHDLHGQIMGLFVLVIAASESAIALALFVLMYRQYGSLDTKVLTNIEG